MGGVLGVGVAVRAVMDDAVHIEVEAVELGDSVLCDELRDGRIALREPAEKFGNTCLVLACAYLEAKADVPMAATAVCRARVRLRRQIGGE